MSKPKLIDAYTVDSETIVPKNINYATAYVWSDDYKPEADDRVGYFVTYNNTNRINNFGLKKADSTSHVLGVVVDNPGFISGGAPHELPEYASYVVTEGIVDVRTNIGSVVPYAESFKVLPNDEGIAVKSDTDIGYTVLGSPSYNMLTIILDPNVEAIRESSSIERGDNLLIGYYSKNNNIKGTTKTINDDGSITYKGILEKSASDDIFDVYYYINLKSGVTYTFSGCPKGGSDSTYCIILSDRTSSTDYGIDTGEGVTFTPEKDGMLGIQIMVNKSADISKGITFYPMLEESSVRHKYDPIPSSKNNLRYREEFFSGTLLAGETKVTIPYITNSSLVSDDIIEIYTSNYPIDYNEYELVDNGVGELSIVINYPPQATNVDIKVKVTHSVCFNFRKEI